MYAEAGACAENQICFDDVDESEIPGFNFHQAYCSDHENYIRIADVVLSTISKYPVSVPNTGPIHTAAKAVEAVFTGAEGMTEPIIMSALDIMAQFRVGDHWRNGRMNTCVNCSSIELDPIPKDTARYVVGAQLPMGIDHGSLYMTFI